MEKKNIKNYRAGCGGCLLDLGVYVFQQAKHLLQALDQSLLSFDSAKSCARICTTPEGVDVGVEADLDY